MKFQHANELGDNLGIGDHTTCAYQLIYNENENDDAKIQYLICMDWDYASGWIVMCHICSMYGN